MAARRCALLPLLLCLSLAQSAWAVAPTVAISTPANGATVLQTQTVSGTITGTLPVTVTLRADGGTEVDATVINTSFSGSVTFPSGGAHTITATATNADGSDSATIDVAVNPAPVITIDSPVEGFSTGAISVPFSGSVSDDDLDPTDPNALKVNGTAFPLDGSNHFSGTVNVGTGNVRLRFVSKDKGGNTTIEDVNGTRSSVCIDPTAPTPDNSDPSKPHLFIVDRLDDLPLQSGEFDPNSAVACDVRRDLHPNSDPPQFDPPGGRCTLRAALQVANAHTGVDLIQLPSSGLVKLTRQGEGDDRGDLDVKDDVFIAGFGRDISGIDARKLKDRIIDVAPGKSLTMFGATLQGGQTPKKSDESGGCIRFAGGRTDTNDPTKVATFRANNLALLDCKSGADGGAIELQQDPNAVPPVWDVQDPNAADPANVSKLTCGAIARSSAKKDGGAIHSQQGVLVLRNTTIAFTSAGASGGAVSVRDGRLVLKNSTLSTNKAKTGGGLSLAGGADATINNTTFAKNKAKKGMSLSTSDEGGGANDLVVSNTILGDKPKSTCDLTGTSPLVSDGGNLDPGETCHLSDAADLPPNTDPRLDKLATNAGTPTHALLPDSPAIDAGVFALCEPLDERDKPRVDGPGGPANNTSPDQCDIGAFEFASTPSP